MRYLWFLTIPLMILYFFFDNLIEYKRMIKFKNSYAEFFMKKDGKFNEYKDLSIRLLKKAGIEDSNIPTSQKMGYGQIANINASIFENCLLNDGRFVSAFMEMLESATGIFRYRMFSAINPIKWIEIIIFLPKTMLTYFNIKNETTINIFQVIYWLANFVLIVLQIIDLI